MLSVTMREERLREGKGMFIQPLFADERSILGKDEFFNVIQWMVFLTCILIILTKGLQRDVVYSLMTNSALVL